jgi:hypothetical protein
MVYFPAISALERYQISAILCPLCDKSLDILQMVAQMQLRVVEKTDD